MTMNTMTMFILLAAVLVLIALGFLIYTLRKTQRGLSLVLGVTLPLATLGVYTLVGNPNAINISAPSANSEQPVDINTAISQLEQELKANPSNIEGWLLLARSHMAMENYEPALAAFKKARELTPDDADIKSEYAEALLRTSNNREFSAEALALLEESAQANPDNQRALFFLGMHYLQQGDGAKAETYLQRLLPKLDSDAAKALMAQIDIARQQQNKAPLSTAESETEIANRPEIKISVEITSELIGAIKPGDVLFVFAKTIDGAGPPVAAKRVAVNGFPIQLSLSDNDSLMPTAKLSSQEKIQLIARISHNGIANVQPGDIEADAVVSTTKNKEIVRLRLSRVIP
jgi:cytochrome c-type biogenesis protein CcmH